MEFVQGQKEYHSDDNQEEEEDQEDQVKRHNNIITSKFSSPPPSSSYNNAPSSNYKASSTVVLPHHDHHHHHHPRDEKSWVGSSQAAEAINFMDLSLRNANAMDHDRIIQANFGSGNGGGDNSSNNWPPNDEREHMFDKVVTPSDVGKLNRLVIPKQHAEKYFPLDSSSNEKGLLLNFQDRTGKAWRFRYSYWNSSQSYVMTKGWSRFVKEKKLDAGDIVSFERGVGDSGNNFLYIDWRRRPPPPPQSVISPLQFVNNHHQTVRVGGSGRVVYSLQRPPPSSISMPLRHHEHFHQQHFNYNIHPYLHQQHQHNYHHQLQHHHGGFVHDHHHGGLGQIERLRGGGGDHVIHHHPMVIDSVPAAFLGRHGKISTSTGTNTSNTSAAAAAKRLRLFGVNMEYQEPDDEDDDHHQCHQILSSTTIPHVTVASLSHHLPSSSLTPLELRLPTGPVDLSKRAKPTSLSFYLDP